ncbi:MAG: HesA/MoeB/ThiF family protein [Cyclobacteriaceae bacterium]|nr:HesA/MoeB/ThiF family protein [Cyclobacteriaceae bacterium]
MHGRYQRQIKLKDFGEAAQNKLLHAKVIVIGAGGLGCPALQYLAAAGVGTLGIVDEDVVSLENLHRQLLYTTGDIGRPKTECARSALLALNPEVMIMTFSTRLTNQNALEILQPYDLVIDGTDNFTSRYLINDACVLLNKPLIYGSVSQYEGQLSVFNYATGKDSGVNYRDVFPRPPGEGEVMNCEEAGVLGVLPGIIGTMQANEAIKLVTGIGKPLANQLFIYHALTSQVYQVELTASENPESDIPASEEAYREFDYHWFCSSGFDPGCEIDVSRFNELVKEGNVAVIDIRTGGNNLGFKKSLPYYRIPFSALDEQNSLIGGENEVVVVCESGISSKDAVKILSEKFGPEKKIYSLHGGIREWKKYLDHETERT